MKKRIALVLVLAVVVLVFPFAAEASPPQAFYLVKGNCGPDTCEILESNFQQLEGGVVYYLGPILGKDHPAPLFLSSAVLLVGTDGSTASGQFRWVGDRGYWTLRQGTGSLAGLHGEGAMCTDAGWETFTLTGFYHFAP
jgi:hypothetical protein